jgi:hypothetical protein
MRVIYTSKECQKSLGCALSIEKYSKSSPQSPTSFFKDHFHGGGGSGLHPSELLGSGGW